MAAGRLVTVMVVVVVVLTVACLPVTTASDYNNTPVTTTNSDYEDIPKEALSAIGWCCEARNKIHDSAAKNRLRAGEGGGKGDGSGDGGSGDGRGGGSGDGGIGGNGCPGIEAGYITPNIMYNGPITMSWKARRLVCPSSSNIVYYDNTTAIVAFNPPLHSIGNNNGGELSLLYAPHHLFDIETLKYCLEDDGEAYRVAVCQPDRAKMCSGKKDCVPVPKCCAEGEVLHDQFTCRGSNESHPLRFSSIKGEPVSAPAGVVVVGKSAPNCSGEGSFPSIIREKFNLLVNGELLDQEDGLTRDFDNYCIETNYDNEDRIHTDGEVVVVQCTASQSKAIEVKYNLMKAGYVISCFFLTTTILLHVLIPSLRDTQGLILLSHMVSMLVALAVLFILAFFTKQLSNGFCIFFGFLFQFSFLAMFFWLNIMCFDIWRVIRATAKGIPLVGILSDDAKKFRLYCLYGWGSPLVILIVTTIMHTLPDSLAQGITRPGFGKLTCWLPGDIEHLIYCYSYVAVLFVLDIAFIGHTMIVLYQAGSAFMCFARQVTVTAFNRKHLEVFWQRFCLFILMVFCWTTELLSWKIKPQEIWIVTDFINSLQGLILFLIFISGKKRRDLVRELMKKVFASCRRRFPGTEGRPSITSQDQVSAPSKSTEEESMASAP